MKNRCAYCRRRKRAPKVKRHPANDHWRDDPYCSRECCEADHAEKRRELERSVAGASA